MGHHVSFANPVGRTVGALTRRLPLSVAWLMGDVHHDSTTNCQVELDSHAKQCCVSEQCALFIHNYD